MRLRVETRSSLPIRRRLRGKGAEPLRAAVNRGAAAPAAHAPSFSHHVPSPPASRRTRDQLRRSGVEGVEPPPAPAGADPKDDVLFLCPLRRPQAPTQRQIYK